MNAHRIVPALAIAVGASLFAAGCGSGRTSQESAASAPPQEPAQVPASTGTITAADREQAGQLFSTRCATCHGAEGRGDGAGGAALKPGPRNFHDVEWQKATSDETIEQAIVYGGAAVGKSPAMVPNPDLQAKPGVVKALREKVRSFGK